ncbi:hypothetical protein BJP34_25720 [Moorena producens PAL-8-15-08-1]|uniref:Uncharacterized protein n=1 Tax=Moorena producens PAL-8-15-08-1 TaxID=1458985 RepID=A0A1D8TY64_9CYAN|nr:hypothetical protein BJP34_25720 [Moorena producens PAL-8-15-08-1]
MNTVTAKRISEKFFYTEFCPPSPPTLGGKRVNLFLKVPRPPNPPILGGISGCFAFLQMGTNGGLDVANETSQTTYKVNRC